MNCGLFDKYDVSRTVPEKRNILWVTKYLGFLAHTQTMEMFHGLQNIPVVRHNPEKFDK